VMRDTLVSVPKGMYRSVLSDNSRGATASGRNKGVVAEIDWTYEIAMAQREAEDGVCKKCIE
jgi:hypothetical protein